MDFLESPHVLDLGPLGVVEGVSLSRKFDWKPVCHTFRGIPFALPLSEQSRWQRPRPLPKNHSYGTRSQPGRFVDDCGVCPQPGYLSPPQRDTWNEDCLQLNIWLPAGLAPTEGWPVYFYIHGGSLQMGSPNELHYSPVLSQTGCQCIIVCAAYRLNVFGFFSSDEIASEASQRGEPGTTSANFGFWDQRLALEWTKKNIAAFGGDASNLTVGGHSAGSHSSFHQLAHDLYCDKPIGIRRIVMFSNGPGVQPKTAAEAQEQAKQLYAALEIPSSLSPTEKIKRLRATPAEKLIDINKELTLHQWRATTDGAFVRHQLFADIESGDFARRMLARDVHLLIGEVSDERFIYSTWYPPMTNTIDSLRARLSAEYPADAVEGTLQEWFPSNRLPRDLADWKSDAFGRVYADMQVHAAERGFVAALTRAGAGSQIHRYRIEWRAKAIDNLIPQEFGVTHITDMIGVWWFGSQLGLEPEEKEIVRGWIDGLGAYIRGEKLGSDWGGPKHYRLLSADGKTSTAPDTDFDRGSRVWNASRRSQRIVARLS